MVYCEGPSLLDVRMGTISGEVSHLVEEHATSQRIHSIKHEAFIHVVLTSVHGLPHWHNINPALNDTMFLNVGTPSTTLARHTSSIGSTYDMGWRGTVMIQCSCLLCFLNIAVNDHRPKQLNRCSTAGLMLRHRLRRWPSINPALGQRLVFVWDVLGWHGM